MVTPKCHDLEIIFCDSTVEYYSSYWYHSVRKRVTSPMLLLSISTVFYLYEWSTYSSMVLTYLYTCIIHTCILHVVILTNQKIEDDEK